jgi:membrane-associated protease RseP (regulator of RpoE activity)
MSNVCHSTTFAAAAALAFASLATPVAAQQAQDSFQRFPPAMPRAVDPRTPMRQPIRRPVIGVLLAPDAEAGVQVVGVTPDGGAASAGLRSGDRIVGIDGKQVLGSNAELRLENARKLLGNLNARVPVKIAYVRGGQAGTVSVTPKSQRMQVWVNAERDVPEPDFRMRRSYAERDHERAPGVAPEVHREVIRIASDDNCKNGNCRTPMLMEALRWNGLNLATVDAKLGRYFGTDRGVLVLSSGPDLAGLQAGDVIHKVDGKAVDTPREAMAALRAKPADSLVAIEYLRDRKPGSAKVKVPEAMPLRVPMPPRPPRPPVAPAPPAPPPPPPGTAFEQEMLIDGNHVAFAFAPEAPVPPDAPLPPIAPEIVEEIELRTYSD